MKQSSTRLKGHRGEELAAEYLRTKGYKILERNYRFERGEIDLVAEEGDELVFVEVKARGTTTFGDPEDAVTESKQRQLQKVAEGYYYERNIEGKNCRFDVVAIMMRGEETEIRHIRDAF